jgi:DNA polymerase-3 subunit delta'
VSGFDSIFSQDRPVKTLTRLLEKGKIPHAMLFTGMDGVGKRLTALTFAMALNCENRGKPSGAIPCGLCRSCKKIQAGSHPDILMVEPEGSMIKIQQIRNLIQALALKPYEAEVRVVIIRRSHTLNPAAGNALLKVLEEPPNSTLLILTAPQTGDILPTLASRCRPVRFNPLSVEHIQILLEKNMAMEEGKARILAAMASGSFSRALTRSKANWISRRQWLISSISLDRPDGMNALPIRQLLAFSEKLAGNKETAMASLEILAGWLRDLVVWRYRPESIIHQDLKEDIQKASGKKSVQQLYRMFEIVLQAERDIRTNMNVRLCLDRMMLSLSDV